MAKSTKALLTGRIQKCKTNPSIAHIGLATHGRSIQIGSSNFVNTARGAAKNKLFGDIGSIGGHVRPLLRPRRTRGEGDGMYAGAVIQRPVGEPEARMTNVILMRLPAPAHLNQSKFL
jgi:hypothetical protein